MASVALDGTRLGTAESLTRPGTWLVSPRYDLGILILSAAPVVFPHLSYSVMLSFLLVHYYLEHFVFLERDRVITPRFGRP